MMCYKVFFSPITKMRKRLLKNFKIKKTWVLNLKTKLDYPCHDLCRRRITDIYNSVYHIMALSGWFWFLIFSMGFLHQLEYQIPEPLPLEIHHICASKIKICQICHYIEKMMYFESGCISNMFFNYMLKHICCI